MKERFAYGDKPEGGRVTMVQDRITGKIFHYSAANNLKPGCIYKLSRIRISTNPDVFETLYAKVLRTVEADEVERAKNAVPSRRQLASGMWYEIHAD